MQDEARLVFGLSAQTWISLGPIMNLLIVPPALFMIFKRLNDLSWHWDSLKLLKVWLAVVYVLLLSSSMGLYDHTCSCPVAFNPLVGLACMSWTDCGLTGDPEKTVSWAR